MITLLHICLKYASFKELNTIQMNDFVIPFVCHSSGPSWWKKLNLQLLLSAFLSLEQSNLPHSYHLVFLKIQYVIQSHRQLFLVHQKISRHGRASHIYVIYLLAHMNVWNEKVLQSN